MQSPPNVSYWMPNFRPPSALIGFSCITARICATDLVERNGQCADVASSNLPVGREHCHAKLAAGVREDACVDDDHSIRNSADNRRLAFGVYVRLLRFGWSCFDGAYPLMETVMISDYRLSFRLRVAGGFSCILACIFFNAFQHSPKKVSEL